jgi:cysteine sulfinate desulfinase/cysteine desulfurase-like protein
VVGLGAACAIAKEEMEYDHKHVSRLSNKLVQVKSYHHAVPIISKRTKKKRG